MNKSRVVLPGAIIGALLLGLAVVFAVVLPKVSGHSGELTLPDRLPGGYVAADLPSAYDALTTTTAADKARYASQQATSRKYAAKTLKSVGYEGVTRNYLTKDGQSFVAVQLIRAGGGALTPFIFTDPSIAQQGQQLDHLLKVGKATCIETGVADGSGKVQQSVIECQRSEGGLTLQVTTQAAQSTVGKLVDKIWAAVA